MKTIFCKCTHTTQQIGKYLLDLDCHCNTMKIFNSMLAKCTTNDLTCSKRYVPRTKSDMTYIYACKYSNNSYNNIQQDILEL